MPEAHQPAVASLDPRDERRHVLDGADLLEHAQHRFVGSPMERPPERGSRAGNRRIRVHVRAADDAHRGGAAVLLVVGVQDEEHVERALENGVRLVLQLGHLEQHVQEVAREAQVVVGIDVVAADAVAVRVARDARDLCDEPQALAVARFLIEDELGIAIERRERADRTDEDAHRMGVVLEPLHQLLDVLMQQRVLRDGIGPVLQLRCGRQLPEDDQIRRFEVVAVFGQMLDRVAAILEDALVAVDVRDGAAARRRVEKRRVVGHQARVVCCRP